MAGSYLGGDEMNKEEICSLALEAGFMLSTMHGQDTPKLMPVSDSATLVKFAQLVAAHEREECAKLVDDMEQKSQTLGRIIACQQISERIRART